MSNPSFLEALFRRLSPWAVVTLFALMLAGTLGVRDWPHALAVPVLALALAGFLPLHRAAVLAMWLLATAGLLWLDARGHARAVLGTLPVLVNAGLCVLFARTLRQGHEPLVTRVVRMVEGEDRLQIPGVAAYTRAVTWYWALLTGMQVLLLAACWSWVQWPGASAPPAVRLWLHAGGYALPVLAMLAEYAWRRLRFRGHPHLAPHRFARRLVACWPRIVRDPPPGTRA